MKDEEFLDIRKLSKKQLKLYTEKLNTQLKINKSAISNLIENKNKKYEDAILFAIKNLGIIKIIDMLQQELENRKEKD